MDTIKLYFRNADVALLTKIKKTAKNNGISINRAIMSLLRREIKKVEVQGE